MRELDDLIFSRITDDADLINLIHEAGGQEPADKDSHGKPHDKHGKAKAWGHYKCHYAHQRNTKDVPQLNFYSAQISPGRLGGDYQRTLEATYEFNVVANNCVDQLRRLRQLFDGFTFDVPDNSLELGVVSSIYEWEGDEGFDETLKENYKSIRFRFFVVPKPVVAVYQK